MSEHTETILRAAANILREDALDRVRQAQTTAERECVNAALLASLAVERYLSALADLERPF